MAKSSSAFRSYVLVLRPNPGKAEAARYAIWWSQRWCLDYVRLLYGEKPNATVSTVGMGSLNHSAQKTARDMLRAGRAAGRATGKVFECPTTAPAYAIALLKTARVANHFPLWATIPTLAPIPLQPHRAFSRALRAGGQVTTRCQVRIGKNGGLVARVCVEMPRVAPTPSRDYLGCDVGVNQAVSTSDGYAARSLRPILDRTRLKRAEQHRQGHPCGSARSAVKQRLDHEARKIVTLAKRGNKTLVLERLKTLGNMKPRGSIGGWARRHFGERARQIASVLGVAVLEVHPAYTSITCRRCDHVDPKNRRGTEFECRQCGSREHADVHAARNLVRRARGVRFGFPIGQKSRVTNANVSWKTPPCLSGVLS